MSNLYIFNFHQTQVRIQSLNNEPLFCLTDVINILQIKNANASRFNMSEAGIHKMYIRSGGQSREVTFINEPNLYRVIFRSNKKEAVDFQNWVFEEVLPAIRKSGGYSLTINSGQQQAIQQAVNERVYRTGERHQAIYTKLHQQFKIPRYQDLPVAQFDNAIEFLGGLLTKPEALTSNELCNFAWLCRAADHMRTKFEEIEPALRTLKSEHATMLYTMSREYRLTIQRCKKIVQTKMKITNVDYDELCWQRVLPYVQ